MNNKELIIFDFDYTLAKTIESIWVWSPRGTREFEKKKYIPIHPSVLSKTKLGDDEQINDESFTEFYSLDIKKSQPINLTIFLLNYYLSKDKQYDVYIITARPEAAKNDIMNFLNKNCSDLTNLNYIGLTNSDPKAKIKCIQNILDEKDYDSISLYEDNEYMINNISLQINKQIKKYYIQSLGKELRISCYEN